MTWHDFAKRIMGRHHDDASNWTKDEVTEALSLYCWLPLASSTLAPQLSAWPNGSAPRHSSVGDETVQPRRIDETLPQKGLAQSVPAMEPADVADRYRQEPPLLFAAY